MGDSSFRRTLVAVSIVAVLLAATPAGAAGVAETKLAASDAAPDSWFGQAVAVSGDTVVVGALQDDHAGTNAGAVYVYTRDRFGDYRESTLVASDATAGDEFGFGLAISGDTIVVGATGDDDNGSDSGSVYVYTRNRSGGYDEAKLTASDGDVGHNFGWQVSMSGDTIVVSAPFHNTVYVYARDRSGGYSETKLTASDTEEFDFFGDSVLVSGDTIVASATGDNDSAGSVYVFTPAPLGGYHETKLTASDGEPGDEFGWLVAASGNSIVASAPGDDDFLGSVYVFTPRPRRDLPRGEAHRLRR